MIAEYLDKAMALACFEQQDGHWYGEIPGFRGVWSDGDTQEECRAVLQEVLEGWILLKIHAHDGDIPVLDEIDFNAIGVLVEDAWDESA